VKTKVKPKRRKKAKRMIELTSAILDLFAGSIDCELHGATLAAEGENWGETLAFVGHIKTLLEHLENADYRRPR
jgi:hypothetical protein